MLLAADEIRIIYAILHIWSTCTCVYEPVLYKRNVRVIHARLSPGFQSAGGRFLEPASGGQREALVIVDTG